MTKKKKSKKSVAKPAQDYNLAPRACPFCKGAPKIHRNGSPGLYEYMVECDNTDCRVVAFTLWSRVKELAVKTWNGEK